MKYKFHVGQVVMHCGGFYEISDHHYANEIAWYDLSWEGDKYYEMAAEDDLKRLTKRQKG